jgi:hypothetical protein
MTSLILSIKARYSTSAKDKTTIDYFFSHHDIGEFPILKIKPLLDLRYFMSPTQSASTKASSSMFPPLL